MTPVAQTLIHDERTGVYGNCFRACVASLLDLPIKDVPAFETMRDREGEWWREFERFLNERGFDFDGVEYDRPGDDEPGVGGYFIVNGDGPRGYRHSVVCDRRGELVHDPHPQGGGVLANDQRYFVLVRRVA